jgi:predicted ATPase
MRALSGTRPIVRGSSLAAEPSDFIGRATELATLGRLLEGEARLVTIVGPRGIGKTRLARRYAALRQTIHTERAVDSVWFFDLRAATDEASLCATVLAVLSTGDEPAARRATVDGVGRALACRDGVLLVLDNADHLLPGAARVLEAWSSMAPDTSMLVTSRVPLGASGERVLELGALGLPGAAQSSASLCKTDALSSDAVQLFLTRASTSPPPRDAPEIEQVAKVVEHLDGVPLAIELAATAAASVVIDELLDRISEGASAVERGWSLLEVWQQEALSQTSVFRDGFTLEAASTVLLLPKGAPRVADAVLELAQRCLLEVTRYDPLRFTMAESIRAHAAEALARSGAALVAERRHAQYYADLGAQLAGLSSAPRSSAGVPSAPRSSAGRAGNADAPQATGSRLAEAARERRNFSAAMAYGAAADRPAITVRAAVALEIASLGNGLSRCELDALDRALASRERLDAALVQRALGARAATMLAMGSLAESRGDGLAALALAETRGDLRQMTALHHLVATATLQAGDASEALEHLERALEIERGRAQPGAMVGILHQLGTAHLTLGDAASARLHFEGAVALAVEAGDGPGEARVANALGSYHLAYGEREDAHRYYARAERLARSLGMHRTLRIITAYQGLLAFEEADAERARWLFATAVVACREAGDARLEGFFEGFFASAVAMSNDVKEVREAFARAEALLADNPFYLEVVALERGFLDLAEARAALTRKEVPAARDALRAARTRIHVASMPARGTPPLLARSDDARMLVRILAREMAMVEATLP